MIKKLKRKFIILATVSLFILMSVVGCIMNLIDYSSVVTEADRILNVLSQPNAPFNEPPPLPDKPPKDIENFIPRGMSPEVPYESRFFTVTLSESGEIVDADFSRTFAVDSESVEDYVRWANSSDDKYGFTGQFRFVKQTDGQGTRIIFLDCGRRLDAFYRFMWISIAVGLSGCAVVFVVFLFAAERIVRPIADSYERQKRFITDAGHEIKTPLTIIGANLDLLEADCGESESIADIRTQTRRLSDLTNDLVYLSKMEETGDMLKKVEFPVSELIEETAQPFQVLAQAQKKAYSVRIEPDLTLCGAPDAVSHLIYILLDNAIKYSPEGGTVAVEAYTRKRELVLSVYNTTVMPIPQENLARLFDRFYRTDASRNSETGGHGIGLSIAHAITDAHNGKISADTQNGCDLKITVTLPQ